MMVEKIRRHKFLSALGLVLILLLITVVGVIIFSERLVRTLVEEKGSNALGRELVLEGPLTIDWHWTYTHVHGEHIRLANAEGYSEPSMVIIESLDLTIKPLKLLVGKWELGDIIIQKPMVILERKSADNTNWDFPALSAEPEPTRETEGKRGFPIINRLEIKNGSVVYRDAIRQLELDLKLDSVSGSDKTTSNEQKNDNNKNADENSEYGFNVTGKGALQDNPFTINASGGSLESLRDSTKNFPLRVKIIMDKTRVEIKGVFNEPFKLSGIDARLKIEGDNLADLFYLTAVPLPPTPPYTLEGRLTKDASIWGYHEFTGQVGGSDLAGGIIYDLSGPRGFFKANLFSNVLDSADLGGFIGLPPALDGEEVTAEQQQAAAEKKASPRLIPDVPLNVERLRATDLDVMLKAKEINAPNLPFKGAEVRFYLKDSQLTLDPFNVVLADGTVDGTIKVDARNDVPPMTVDLNLRKLSLGKFFENTRFAETTRGFFGGKVSLKGTGASLADVLGTSNGEMAIITSGGNISLLLIEASDIDIGEAIPLFLGKDKSTGIRCGVADFDVKNGLLNSKSVVLDTEDSTLVGKVDINLKEEQINARLDAKPKDNSVLSARIPITINGQLKSPRIGLDAERTSARGAAAIALGTLLSPFAAILAFIDNGEGENADCRALISAAQK